MSELYLPSEADAEMVRVTVSKCIHDANWGGFDVTLSCGHEVFSGEICKVGEPSDCAACTYRTA